MAFDVFVTKAIVSELQQLSGARLDKIFQPNSNNIVLGCYLDGANYAINISTNSPNYRIHLTTHPKPNPKVAPNFCMVLRKHLLGLHIKNIIAKDLERIVTIEFEGFDDIDDIICKKLVIELMGKHCNVILLDDNNIIIDSLRHINNENSTHIVVPHIRYTYPETNSSNFIQLISKQINTSDSRQVDDYINNMLSKIDTHNVKFEFSDSNYYLAPCDNLNSVNMNNNNPKNFELNFELDDFYYEKETTEDFKSYRDSVLKLILATLKKYNKKLSNINDKLTSCNDMDTYKLYGELITANLYQIKNENISKIELENYYDNNNKITIPLDSAFTPAINAKKFFKKYNKLKNALEIVSIQKDETINELNYIESIVYELESATSISDVAEIFEEISENDIFKEKTNKYKNKKTSKIKKTSLTKNKLVNFNPIKYTIDGFTLLVGRNNKENDYLTLKYAHKSDIWFHTKDIHGSHSILILDGKTPSPDILLECAKLAAYHSKARLSSNVPVDFCEVRYVKKPNGAKPGMVIYTNNYTLYVTPEQK